MRTARTTLERLRHGLALALAPLLAALLCACGGPSQGPADVPAGAQGPVGRWTLDRAALLESVRRRFGGEGPEVLAREEAQSRGVSIELELRGDGAYALLTTYVGGQQHCLGTWTRDGATLALTCSRIDGVVVPAGRAAPDPDEAVYEDDRIRVDFAQMGLTFTLMRR